MTQRDRSIKGTATCMGKPRSGWGRGDARIYRLDPPMGLNEFLSDEKTGETEYVAVSAVVAMFTGDPETYIFACDADGEISDWCELDGSYRGGLDHEKALRGAGYEAVTDD